MVEAGETSRRDGQEGRRSSVGKVDDNQDEARGRDARILVRSSGGERSISCNGRRRRGISFGMVVEDGGGWGGGQRRTEEDGVGRVFWRPRSTNGEKGGREEGGNHVFRARLSQMRGNLQT